jgi:hypothetical protein
MTPRANVLKRFSIPRGFWFVSVYERRYKEGKNMAKVVSLKVAQKYGVKDTLFDE